MGGFVHDKKNLVKFIDKKCLTRQNAPCKYSPHQIAWVAAEALGQCKGPAAGSDCTPVINRLLVCKGQPGVLY
jgi:hypothetical protein